MYNNKYLSFLLLITLLTTILIPLHSAQAASLNEIAQTLSASTVSDQNGASGGLLGKLFNLLFNDILGPILNIFSGKSSSGDSGIKVTPLPPKTSANDSVQDSSVLRGKVIAIDPGHGGNNPGAVANNTRESDNNLAVGLKLYDKLVQSGAKVVMTRNTDRNVATPASTLGQELQARLDIATANKADMFVSIHSNSNPNSSIAGAMTFFPSGKSEKLAQNIQTALIKETNAVDKGTSPATFYVLRNAAMPATLVEMGFVTNANEAALLRSDSYRNKVAQGIYKGIVRYFN